jgi:hypothetical protein
MNVIVVLACADRAISRTRDRAPFRVKVKPRLDSHVDSHGGATRYESVNSVDGTHERSGRETPPDDAMDAEHADF